MARYFVKKEREREREREREESLIHRFVIILH